MGRVCISQIRVVIFLHQIIPTDGENHGNRPFLSNNTVHWDAVCFASSVISESS